MSQKQATLTDEEGEEIPEGYFEPGEIRRRLPTSVTDKQERVGVCVIRNPDAPLTGISEATAVSSTTVLNTVKALVNRHGLEGNGVRQAVEARNGIRAAETYQELTDKQKAVVDWCARHSGTMERLLDAEEDLTAEQVATAIESDERYDVALHSTYPLKVLKGQTGKPGYAHLVEERREELALSGELEDEEVDTTSLRAKPPRDWLERAGWTLPESNLDSLETAEALTREERLELAFENANKEDEEPVTDEDRRKHSAPLTCPECRHEAKADECPKCGHDKRYAWAKEDEDAEETEETEDEGEELTYSEEPLVQDMEAVNEALEGLANRQAEISTALDTLRSNALMETEAEEILGNFEDRLQAALDEHRDEVREAALDAADDRLHNSVRADLVERVEGLEADLGAARAQLDAMDEVDATGRLGLVLDELHGLAEEDAEVRTMEVNERAHTREYVIKVDTGGAAEAMATEDAEAATDGGEPHAE